MRPFFFSVLLSMPALAFAQTPAPQSVRQIDHDHPPFEVISLPPTLSQPSPPIFDVKKYGAKGDAVTFDTLAIQRAINACAGTGGSVYLSAGKFLTAPLVLKGGMTLYINQDAVLLGSTSPQDYPDLMPPHTVAQALRKSLLFASGVDHLNLDGGGIIDGQGQLLPMTGKEPFRPSLLRIFNSTHVTVQNLTMRNPRMWTQVYSECSNLTLDHLKVFSPAGYCENLDGMDICDSDHVTISNCQVEAQDDGICLKSHGPRGLHDIMVKNNTVTDFDANGIKIGTATNGPIEHLDFENNVIMKARFGGFCLESVDGSHVDDVTVRGLDMRNVSQPIFIRLAHRTPPKGDLQFVSLAQHAAGSIDNVLIENVRSIDPSSKTTPSNTITGIPDAKLGRIIIRNAYFEMPGGISIIPPLPAERDGKYPQSNLLGTTPSYAFYIRHAAEVIFDHVTTAYLKPDVRPWLTSEDASTPTSSCKDSGPLKP